VTRVGALALLAAVAAFAAGCGSSASTAPVATHEVSMAKSYRFDPKVVEIKAGESVTWTNNDNFTHTVHVDGQADHKVDRGTYGYVCTLHSHDMHGEVIVR
jgi:plastocyanin